LGKLRAKPAVPALCSALTHSISNLRKEAVIALGEIGDVRAVKFLELAQNDVDSDVRKLSKLALATIVLKGGA
jgi:HEAT repeat protein